MNALIISHGFYQLQSFVYAGKISRDQRSKQELFWGVQTYARFLAHLSASAILLVPLPPLKPHDRCVKVQLPELYNLRGLYNSSFVPKA